MQVFRTSVVAGSNLLKNSRGAPKAMAEIEHNIYRLSNGQGMDTVELSPFQIQINIPSFSPATVI